jgi:hypothetical protein
LSISKVTYASFDERFELVYVQSILSRNKALKSLMMGFNQSRYSKKEESEGHSID